MVDNEKRGAAKHSPVGRASNVYGAHPSRSNRQGECMRVSFFTNRSALLLTLTVMLLAPSIAIAESGGIGGAKSTPTGDEIDDVAKEGCLCHSMTKDVNLTVALDNVPYMYAPGESYTFTLYLIGGPAIDTSSNTGGFSMRVSAGELTEGSGTQFVDGDTTTLTHDASGATSSSRSWEISWTAPAEDSGIVEFWISGNSVNGDLAPSAADSWNMLSINLQEEEGTFPAGTRMIEVGNGEASPPEVASGGIDLHHMGAALRAHWLGLLGFGAVVAVIIFCGVLLRYGFSTSYQGRSNTLRLRYKLNRRGDQ